MKKTSQKNIVCLGGGNAMPKAVLVELKKYPVKISVICAMLDSGGSAGRLRKDYKIVSPGDIRRAFLALSNTSPVISELFDFRFKTGELKDHNFANLFITALELSTNSNQNGRYIRRNACYNYEKTSYEIKKILNIQHEVLPVTLDNSEVWALLENGKIIKGETNIDIPKHKGDLKIKRVYLKPKAEAYPKATKAIKEADLIIIGPGDLYSSLAQILLTQGIPRAIQKSKGKSLYICNLMTKWGETNGFTVLDFTNKIEKFLGKKVDYVIYNTKSPSPKRLAIYKKEHPELLDLVKSDENLLCSKKFIGKDLLTKSGAVNHEPKKLVKTVLNLCKL